jgi:putative pyruvate formate lyase activating enzyme
MTSSRRDPSGFLAPWLSRCTLCARRCGVDRLRGERGACGAGLEPRVACWVAHRGEEPPLVGAGGSGAIFFSGCSLRCLFCQNHAISQSGQGREISLERLAGILLELEGQGCSNINLVSPTHYVPQIFVAVESARRQGLRLPVVYNSHGYDSPEALECMRGVVDVYLPDMKYANNDMARELSGVQGYRDANRAALRNMFAQVGHLQEDPRTGVARRGLIVRILVLPGGLEGARASLAYLRSRFSTDLAVSLMAQYAPLHHARRRPPLDRTLEPAEYEGLVDLALRLGFRRVWLQDPRAARSGIPDFSAENPFVF